MALKEYSYDYYRQRVADLTNQADDCEQQANALIYELYISCNPDPDTIAEIDRLLSEADSLRQQAAYYESLMPGAQDEIRQTEADLQTAQSDADMIKRDADININITESMIQEYDADAERYRAEAATIQANIDEVNAQITQLQATISDFLNFISEFEQEFQQA